MAISNTKDTQRTVQFGTVECKVFPVTLSACTVPMSGPPIGIDYNAKPKSVTTCTIDEYEKRNPSRRTDDELLLTSLERSNMLLLTDDDKENTTSNKASSKNGNGGGKVTMGQISKVVRENDRISYRRYKSYRRMKERGQQQQKGLGESIADILQSILFLGRMDKVVGLETAAPFMQEGK